MSEKFSDSESRTGSFESRSRRSTKSHDENFNKTERKTLDKFDCEMKRFVMECTGALQSEITCLKREQCILREEAFCAIENIRGEFCQIRDALRRVTLMAERAQESNAALLLRTTQLQRIILAAGLVADATEVDWPASQQDAAAGGANTGAMVPKVARAMIGANLAADLAVGGPVFGNGVWGNGYGNGLGCGCGVNACGGGCGWYKGCGWGRGFERVRGGCGKDACRR